MGWDFTDVGPGNSTHFFLPPTWYPTEGISQEERGFSRYVAGARFVGRMLNESNGAPFQSL